MQSEKNRHWVKIMGLITLSQLATGADGTFQCHNLFSNASGPSSRYVTTCGGNGWIINVPKSSARIEVLTISGVVISPVQDGTGNQFVADGIFSLGILRVPGVLPGQSADIVIRIWNTNTGPAFESASARRSERIHFWALGEEPHPPALQQISDYQGIHVVPIFVGPWDPQCPPQHLNLSIYPNPLDRDSIRVQWQNVGEWIRPNLQISDDMVEWQPVSDRCCWNGQAIPLDRAKAFFRLQWTPYPAVVWPE